MLHYDVWAEGLGQLYFLDPNWLANMIAAVLKLGVIMGSTGNMGEKLGTSVLSGSQWVGLYVRCSA